MTQPEIEKMLHEMVEQKCQPAFDKLPGFKRCEELFNMMAKESAKLAEAFKNIVFYTLVLHPDYTEQQVLESFYNKMYNK